MFEYWNFFSVIVIGLKNSASTRNLSPWANSRAEKSHQTFPSLRLGQVPFKIIFLENDLYHRDHRSTEQYFTQAHGKIRDRPKLFEIIFEFCSQQIMILQLLTSRLIPKFSKNSNEDLLFRYRKVSELRKMHF